MLSEKKFTIRFFLIHLCLIIPMLLTSVFAVSMVADRMMKLERKTALRQLESVVSDLEEIYSNYYEESVLLSGMSQLRPQKIMIRKEKLIYFQSCQCAGACSIRGNTGFLRMLGKRS